MRNIFLRLILVAALTVTAGTALQAQVTIGSGEMPNPGALLDLKQDNNTGTNSNRGLGLPRVELKLLTKLQMGSADEITDADAKKNHAGLVVYNVTKNEVSAESRLCPGIHVWDGAVWQPLVAYPATQERLIEAVLRSFEYLDPNNSTGWTGDKTPSNYPLGEASVGIYTDERDKKDHQTYTYSRFYVGYKVKKTVEKKQFSYDCSSSPTNWVDASPAEFTVKSTEKIFEDGVWMTQNMRATKTVSGVDLTNSAAYSYTNPYFYYPDNKAENGATFGVLYNWAAATNKRSSTVNEGGETLPGGVEAKTQGICPTGWFLPSDQEWVDLENGIILKTKTFSDTPNLISPLLGYNEADSRKKHGAAMRNTATGTDSKGTSKTADKGGFDSYPAGRGWNGAAGDYNNVGYYWSSSSSSTYESWFRSLNIKVNSVYRMGGNRKNLFSVRCKKGG